jgi:tetratricopeptide (TPR) repeat protein
VAYNSLLSTRRKEIHEKIGRAIEKLYPERLEECYEMLAYHYTRTDNPARAVHYLKSSGHKSLRNNTLGEAFHFYQQALVLLKGLPQTKENEKDQVEIILSMANPMRLLGYHEGSLEILQEGERLAKELDDPKSTTHLWNFIGLFYIFQGSTAIGKKYLEDALVEGERMGDIEIIVPVTYGLSSSYQAGGDHRKSVALLPRVIGYIEVAHREADFFGLGTNPLAQLYGWYGLSLAALGEFRKGKALLDKALRMAQQLGNFYTLGVIEFLFGILFSFKGDGEEGIKHTKKVIEYFEKSQAVLNLPLAWAFLGYGYYLSGEAGNALTSLEKGLEMQKGTKVSLQLSGIHLILSMVHADSGHWTEAMFHAEEGINLSQKNQERINEGWGGLILGRIIGKSGGMNVERAESTILKGMGILEELGIKPDIALGHFYLGELYADAGLKEKALENLKEAENLLQEMAMDYWLERTRKVLEKLG